MFVRKVSREQVRFIEIAIPEAIRLLREQEEGLKQIFKR
jgi:hypothetical protein